jgi:hypothetical protein
MFTTTKEFEIRVRSGGWKTCVLRWPTDEEFVELYRKQQTVRTFVGRGNTETSEFGVDESSALLLAACRKDADGDPMDACTMRKVIDKLRELSTDLPIETDAGWEIRCYALGQEMTHVIKEPSGKQVEDWKGRVFVTRPGRRTVTVTSHIQVSAKLYDELLVSTTGYDCAVPINHKHIVMVNLIAHLEYLEEHEGEA